MSCSENFRTAMRGFNRTDVVQFIQNLTAQHEKELRVLQEENDRLTGTLETAQAERDAAVAEKSALEEQLLTLRERPDAPEASPVDLDAPLAPPEGQPAPSEKLNELELAAYRRAEMAERLARERAASADEQLQALFAQMQDKLKLAAGDFDTVLNAFQTDFERLRQVIQSAQYALSDSGSGVKAVESLFGEL